MPNDSEFELRALNKILAESVVGRWSWDFDETLELCETAVELTGVPKTGPYMLADLLLSIKESYHLTILDALEQCLDRNKAFDLTVELDHVGTVERLRMRAELVPGGRIGAKRLVGLLEPVGMRGLDDGGVSTSLGPSYWATTVDLLCMTSTDGRILEINPAWERTLGYDRDELLGTDLLSWVREADRAHSRQSMSGASTNESGVIVSRFQVKGGSELWLELAWTELISEGLRLWHARDISSFKNEVIDRNEVIETMRDANEELQSFASVASHDLREPLRMISSYLRLLQERYPDALDARAERYINYACDGADRMRRLIEDLLTYARMGNQNLSLEALGLDQIFEEVIDNLSTTIKQLRADVTIEIDQSPVVLGDSVRLVRLFQNLIGNAMKFHAEGVAPRVQVSFEDGDECGEPNCWVVHVRDSGIGIDPDHTDILFNAFQRLNTRDEYEGSGIGLAVCRKLAEQHGGRIWVESVLGQWSRFSVSLKKPQQL